jgi:uncharacterized membrane-anchored protein
MISKHPFEKMFDKALRLSTKDVNLVLKEAKRLREKGYSDIEITEVLEKLEKSLIDDSEAQVVQEALEDFQAHT